MVEMCSKNKLAGAARPPCPLRGRRAERAAPRTPDLTKRPGLADNRPVASVTLTKGAAPLYPAPNPYGVPHRGAIGAPVVVINEQEKHHALKQGPDHHAQHQARQEQGPEQALRAGPVQG